MSEVFVELLHEELPASMVRPALDALKQGVLGLLEGIEHGAAKTWATPRRLAVAVEGVAAGKPVADKMIMGPPADKAFFADGSPTPVAVGFAKGKGVGVDELRVVAGPKGKVVAVMVKEGGETTVDLLAKGLEGVVLGLPFAKSMEWGLGGMRFGRPLHRVNALYDGQVVPANVAHLAAGNATSGHRLTDLGELVFHSSAEWVEGLRARRVEPDLDARKQMIAEALEEARADYSWEIADPETKFDPIHDDRLLEEVTHLVEWPVLVVGEFGADLLDLPPRLLVQSMKQNQRYFPMHRDGQLTNRFVVISNNPWGDATLVASGNAAVLKARFYDAKFFFAEDKRVRLEDHGHKLEKMQWIRGLGSMADKQARVAALAGLLADRIGADRDLALRAGALSKSDLTTLMVGEFPDLQGHVGRLLAQAQGEPEAVATAIEEGWQPRFAGDAPPKTAVGAALAMAERLDTLVGCFGIGITPTGGGDPQGLRRAASGVLAIVDAHGFRVDLGDLFATALSNFHALGRGERFGKWAKERGTAEHANGADALVGDLVAFALTRLEAQAVAEGASADLVQAVLATGDRDVVVIDRKLAALKALAGTPEFAPILQTFKRVLNITKGQSFPVPDPSMLTAPERALADAIGTARAGVEKAGLDYAQALGVVTALERPVAAFFDAVLVDDPDPKAKARRMGLLLDVAALFRVLADFSRISTR